MLAVTLVRKIYPKVEQVVDAPKNITIDITSKDTGKVKKHSECILAEACKKKLHLDGAVVSLRKVFLIKGRTATRYSIPEWVSREIVSFDRGGKFAPGRYVLNKPKPISKVKVTKRTNPSPRRRIHHMTADVRAPMAAL